MTNSTLQDAEIGINAQPFSHFELRGGNVMFNNVDHVVIEPWNNTVSNVVYGTCFTSTALLTNTIGYTQTRYGINFKATTPISIMPINTFMTVGDPLYAQNVFEFCENGIYARGWNLTIQNCLFRQINPTGPITGGKYTGIWYNSMNPRPGQWQLTIAGALGAASVNRFEDSYRGIQINDDGVNATIFQNSFLRCTRDGIFAKNSWESDFYIAENTFVDVAASNSITTNRAAILLSDLCNAYRPAIEVFNNTITTSMPNTYFNYTENSGIHVQGICGPNINKFYYIRNNTISGKRLGIYVNGAIVAAGPSDYSVVECNTIDVGTVPFDPIGNNNTFSAGIYNNNSDNTLIIGNEIRGTGSVGGGFLPQSTGIINNSSINVNISCNSTRRLISHLEMRAPSNPSAVQLNNMYDGLRGLWQTSNGDIGNQGNATWPADNRWWNTWGSCISPGQEGWLHNRNFFAGNWYYYRLFSANTDPTTCNSAAGAAPVWTLSGVSAGAVKCKSCSQKPYDYARYANYEETDTDTFYQWPNAAERLSGLNLNQDPDNLMNWWKEWNFVKSLTFEPERTASDSVWIDFMNNPVQESKIELARALYYLYQNDIEYSVAALARVSENHTFSDAMEAYITVLQEYLGGEQIALTDNQLSILQALAESCPATSGPAVLYAQAFLEDIELSYNQVDCDRFEEQLKIRNSTKPIENSPSVTIVNDQILIRGVLEEEWIEIEVMNLSGSKVFEFSGYYYGKLNAALPNGMYIYQVAIPSLQQRYSGKLSVFN